MGHHQWKEPGLAGTAARPSRLPSPRTPQKPQPGMGPEPAATTPLRWGDGAYLALPSTPPPHLRGRAGRAHLAAGRFGVWQATRGLPVQ